MSGKNAVIAALMASPAMLGPMTAMERRRGRYMRAPDHDAGDAEFAEFEKAGEVQVGSEIETNLPDAEKPAKPGGTGKPPREKPATKAAAEKPDAGKPGEDEGDDEGEKPEEKPEGEDEGEEGEEDEKPAKPKAKASDRIRELSSRVRQRDRLIDSLSTRLEALEKGGLPTPANSGSNNGTGKPAPDHTDAKLYPLGHLDDRYIEDKLEYLAEQKAGERADAVLLRQQETERAQATEREQAVLLEKVENLSTRGSELFDDFQESVVEAGIRGDWKLGQSTFEAAHEAENGAQILYELSQDKKEAARVAGLSPYQQMKFVADRDTELSSKAKPRTKPGAGAPPSTTTKGANSAHRINPATDDLKAFEKAWAADEKGK